MPSSALIAQSISLPVFCPRNPKHPTLGKPLPSLTPQNANYGSDSLNLEGAELNFVVQGEKRQDTLGLEQAKDVQVTPHVGPLCDKDTV